VSFIQAARDALKDLPVSEIAHERLSLALDRLAETEVKNEALTLEKNSLQAQLDRERRDHKQTCQDLQRLKDEHTEEARIYKMVEFRRGNAQVGSGWRSAPSATCQLVQIRTPLTVRHRYTATITIVAGLFIQA
jgi:phage protein D